MKLISFDVGIKNMAYCIIDCSLSANICEWNVVSLLDSEAPNQICTCQLKPKNKKTPPAQCSKVAKYTKNEKYYCDKHSKEHSQFLIPTRQRSPASIKKLKVDELLKLGNSHLAFMNTENHTTWKRAQLVEFLISFFESCSFDPIKMQKSKTASETDLIKIGRNMKTKMDLIDKTAFTNVVIENQISPIANRMKTIQGMLAQYFIMMVPTTEIDFVSSSNKLKQFGEPKSKKTVVTETPTQMGVEPLANTLQKTDGVNPEYKQHKKDGVFYCSKMLDSNPLLESWKGSLEIKKKDDLADCFLQGIWYLKNRNIITFADDLKIKIV